MARAKTVAVEKEEERFEERIEDGEGEELEEGDIEEEGDDDEIDEGALAELLALNGWCSTISPPPYHLHSVQGSSNIPSPFSNPGSVVSEKFWDLMSGPVQQLWRAFHSRRKPSKRQIPTDGSIACCGFLDEEDDKPPTKYYTIESAENNLAVDIDDSTKCFHMRRLKRAADPQTTTGEGFFVINKDFDHFLINGQPMSRGAVAGPLPDFAVIELNSVAVFWWRNSEAFEYVPRVKHSFSGQRKRGLKRSRGVDDEREGKKLRGKSYHSDSSVTSKSDKPVRLISTSSPSRNRTVNTKGSATLKDSSHERQGSPSHSGGRLGAIPTPSGPPKTWQDILNDGVQRHRQCRVEVEAREKAQSTGPIRVLERSDTLSEDETILAIATFWEALRRNGQLFAFAGVDFFGEAMVSNNDFQLTIHGVVGAPEKFIMPLLLHPHQRKGMKAADQTEEVGHHVLVTAEWSPIKEKIRLDIFDSLPGPGSDVYKKFIIERAKDLIMGSQWPYDQEVRPAPAFLSVVTFLASPRQEGRNTCGFYMILNAWCVMLGIPISRTKKRRGHTKASNVFLRDGLEIINLALMGCMDIHTVQAFLNVWGYSQEQKIEDAVAKNVTAVRMNMHILHQALYQQCLIEGRGYKPTPEQVKDLIHNTGLTGRVTFQEMEVTLIEEEGSVYRATMKFLSPSPVVSPADKALQTRAQAAASNKWGGSLSPESQLKRALELSMQPVSPAAVGNVADGEMEAQRRPVPLEGKPSFKKTSKDKSYSPDS